MSRQPSPSSLSLPNFFRIRQQFPRPKVDDLAATVASELASVCPADLSGRRIAITSGSRGVANIAVITKACVDFLKTRNAAPFIVPAMGSHGGATAEGQLQVLNSFGINEPTMGCPILSSMDVVEVCTAKEGFPVYFDRNAMEADDVLVINRIKPHTRFAGELESGLMKMMLIGLGKQTGAEVYHRAIVNYPFDQIVRSVAKEVIARCNILCGLGILENGYEETAMIRVLKPQEIESSEPKLLRQVKEWMPKLPFDKAEWLMINEIGKNISGTGMDTNVIGRKKSDHAAIDGDSPDIHHIYVRGLTAETHGNASGIGLAEMCHKRVVESMNHDATRMNCITAGHVTGAMVPIDFANDLEAITTACRLAGYIPPEQATAMWIHDTLRLEEVECSQAFLNQAKERGMDIIQQPRALEFDASGDLINWF